MVGTAQLRLSKADPARRGPMQCLNHVSALRLGMLQILFFMLGLIFSEHFVHVACSTVSLGSLLRRTGSSKVDLIEGHVDLLTKLLFFSEWQKSIRSGALFCAIVTTKLCSDVQAMHKIYPSCAKKTTVIGLRSTDKWSQTQLTQRKVCYPRL